MSRIKRELAGDGPAIPAHDMLASEFMRLRNLPEFHMQRNTIGELLGKFRDLEADLPEDGIQRLITEKTKLKHQSRHLTDEVKVFTRDCMAPATTTAFSTTESLTWKHN